VLAPLACCLQSLPRRIGAILGRERAYQLWWNNAK
jgi:hypothetical protein